jgi:hypothetical protein
VTRPDLVFHADWATSPKKRWAARAALVDGAYRISGPQPVRAPETLLARLLRDAANGAVVAGFDFPIGVPRRWAEAAGVDDFVALLRRLGDAEWSELLIPATGAAEIATRRPFYPHRPGGTRQAHLLAALGVGAMDDLRRRCDLRHRARGAAEVLFWTLGAKQVGKAAIAGWRDLLAPALADDALDVAIWPFDGPLADLVHPDRVVVVETYPAEACAQLGIRVTKSSREDRARVAPALLAVARDLRVELEPSVRTEVEAGFSNDDRFDAFVGLLGMLAVLEGRRAAGEPPDEAVRRVEGWILGQDAAA